MEHNKGKLIVIDGVDSVGKATHTQLLKEWMVSNGTTVHTVTFPDYGSPTGKLVAKYLNGGYGEASKVHPELASSLYAQDRAAHISKIKTLLETGTTVILDRSPFSNAAFQSTKFDTAKERIDFARSTLELEFEGIGFPIPDLNFFLDGKPSVTRKLLEARKATSSIASDGKQDQHESNTEMLDSAYDMYCLLSKLTCFGKWSVIPVTLGDVIRPIEYIQQDIRKRVELTFI